MNINVGLCYMIAISTMVRRVNMYQIKVNGILMPTIYWSLKEAMEACASRNCGEDINW